MSPCIDPLRNIQLPISVRMAPFRKQLNLLWNASLLEMNENAARGICAAAAAAVLTVLTADRSSQWRSCFECLTKLELNLFGKNAIEYEHDT